MTPDQIRQIKEARARAADLAGLGLRKENIRFALQLEGFATGAIDAAMRGISYD